MHYPSVFIKKFYQLRLKIERLSERDRTLLLVIILLILFGLWFFGVFSIQRGFLNRAERKIQMMRSEIANIMQKNHLIETLVASPDVTRLIARFKELTEEKQSFEKQYLKYTHRYIESRDLAKLLHDMLKETDGVIIDDFATVSLSSKVQTGHTASMSQDLTLPLQSAAQTLSMDATYYQLVLRGDYFEIMNYLKRLEEIPWRLYWDKFDYTVSKYPEGVATVLFYTLKPHDAKAESPIGGSS